MRYGVCAEHFRDRPLTETVEFLTDIGYQGIEITPWTVFETPMAASDEAVAEVRETVRAAGLEVIGIPRVFVADNSTYHIGHSDAGIREQTVDALREVVALCGRLGGSLVIFGSPNQRTVPDEIGHEDAWENALESFRDEALLAELEAAGVTLCMEPISPTYTDFVTTTDEAVAFVEAVDHPNVGVALDGFHLARENRRVVDCIREAGPHLAHFHSDGDTGRGAAEGSLDYGAIIDALSTVGYEGYLSLEIHQLIFDADDDLDPAATAELSLEHLRSLR